jgi:hypothetical protein
MNISVVQEKLSKKYKIDCLIDLNDIEQNKSFSVLYSILEPIKQEQFPDNYRIMVYYCKPLKRTFLDCPCDILDYLQKVLCYYDIPNFFVILITNDTSINDDLEYLRQKYTNNENNCIQSMIVSNLKN